MTKALLSTIKMISTRAPDIYSKDCTIAELTTTNNMSDQQNNKQNSKTMSSLPCYSPTLPPEIGSRVVVSCTRVDDTGIYGTLPDWGDDEQRCSVYLPIGFITLQRGRGERRAQLDFITRVKKIIAKGRPMLLVALVDSIDTLSSNGVDQIDPFDGGQVFDRYAINVIRTGLTKEEEKATMAESKTIQKCAAFVDKAAKKAGLSTAFARKVCLYDPYHRSLRENHGDDKDTIHADINDKIVSPTSTAPNILIKNIGKVELQDASQQVKELLSVEVDSFSIARDNWDTFAHELVIYFRKEYERVNQPVIFSHSLCLGGPSAIYRMIGEDTDGTAGNKADVMLVRTAFSIAKMKVQPSNNCSPVSVTAEGRGKYLLKSKCRKEDENEAKQYLIDFALHAESAYATSVKCKQELLAEAPQAFQANTEVQDDIGADTTPTSSRETLKIGLIGDVANGKSTLIKAMTGKRTQAHSSEQQKHGMTIRLGFANASILRCNSEGCSTTHFFRQNEVIDPKLEQNICPECQNNQTEVVKDVSFLDCPGHAELMATMLSGASAFDAVIFASAANSNCPTPQARQHLDALSMLSTNGDGDGSFNNRIVVAQTKSELVVQEITKAITEGRDAFVPSHLEALAKCCENARDSLRNTVAKNAPIFPVCAPMNIGLGHLASWLSSISPRSTVRMSSQGNPPKLFQVLRSFDVNSAGTAIDDLAGGVVGGSIVSGKDAFRQGELLELRPGLFQLVDKGGGAQFTVQPLQFKLEGIMTGKTQLCQATAETSGLIAFQSSLCPTLCVDDRLVGSVVGSAGGCLPPVWGPKILLMDLKLLAAHRDADHIDIAKDTKVKCHIGSATIPGIVNRISKKRGKIEIDLKFPVCAFKGSNVIIEACISKTTARDVNSKYIGYRLAGNGTLVDGDICLDGSDVACANGEPPTCKDASNGKRQIWTQEEEKGRGQFLEELSLQTQAAANDFNLLSVPKPSVARDGGTHWTIDNFLAIANALNRDPAHLQSYMSKEAGLSCVTAGVGGVGLRIRYRSRGNFAELMQRIIRRYANVYVTCHQCKRAQTEFLAKNTAKDQTQLLCRCCNASRYVPKL